MHDDDLHDRDDREPAHDQKSDLEDACTIPVPVPASELNKFVSPQPEHEAHRIRSYVESEGPDEAVHHLEKVATEYLPGRRLDAWDVHTTHDRYWVITNPTNLYSQQTFPSLDYTITFHVGLTARIAAREARSAPPGERDRLLEAWRRWEQASEELDRADEAEDFQAIGMRCRECLISFIRAIADQSMVPEGQVPPKGADFKEWASLVAASIASGSSAEYVRAYLRSVSKTTWELVNWLTYAKNEARRDGEIAIKRQGPAWRSRIVVFGRQPDGGRQRRWFENSTDPCRVERLQSPRVLGSRLWAGRVQRPRLGTVVLDPGGLQ
jgi:hypothetical protein